MSLERYWGNLFVKMPSGNSGKAVTRSQEKNVSDTAKDGGSETEVTETETLSPAMTKAMASMTANISGVIESNFDSFLKKIGDITKELQETTKRVGEAEQRISAVEDTNTEMEKRVSYLEKAVASVASLRERLDDQEDRGRRNNLRIVGLPESSEGTSAKHFMEPWIPQVLGLTTKAGKVKLERAHRVGVIRRGDDVRKPYSRVMIVRFHHYGDRERVVEAARRAKSVHFEGSRIFFFQDFSNGTQQKRRAFDEARKKLQAMGIQYGLNYPATLRITVNNATKSFIKPAEAISYINTEGQMTWRMCE